MTFRFQSSEATPSVQAHSLVPELPATASALAAQRYTDSAEVRGPVKSQTSTSQPLTGSLLIFACAFLMGEKKLRSFIFNESSLELRKMWISHSVFIHINMSFLEDV